ncbi:MAG: hypothetical protein HC854_05030 [Flavobacterium sp.]|nr:hypothetical protein [Flavobacterium sp.]
MKKSIFSAVALVAFSFAGMASNSVVNKFKVEKKEVKVVKAVTDYNCDALYDSVFSMWFDGNNLDQAKRRATAVRSACVSLAAAY